MVGLVNIHISLFCRVRYCKASFVYEYNNIFAHCLFHGKVNTIRMPLCLGVAQTAIRRFRQTKQSFAHMTTLSQSYRKLGQS